MRSTKFSTVPSLNSGRLDALVVNQKLSFSKILEVGSSPEFAQDHESGLRSDRGPVVLCDFSKLRFWESPYDFFKFVWEILEHASRFSKNVLISEKREGC